MRAQSFSAARFGTLRNPLPNRTSAINPTTMTAASLCALIPETTYSALEERVESELGGALVVALRVEPGETSATAASLTAAGGTLAADVFQLAPQVSQFNCYLFACLVTVFRTPRQPAANDSLLPSWLS